MNLKDFIKEYPRFSPLLTVPGLDKLYELISEPSSIDSMIRASESKRPAIAAIAKILESDFHDKRAGKDGMNFKKNRYLKNFVGNVISHFMQQNGYIKDKNKNLNSHEAKYFSAGTLYVKNESIEELRRKGQNFWIRYELESKVIKILENWHRLSEDYYTPYRIGSCALNINASLDFWPCYEIAEKYYSDRLFVSAEQIAIELERQYPGIASLSELQMKDVFDEEYDPEYNFLSMLNENIDKYAIGRKNKIDAAELSLAHGVDFLFVFEGVNILKSGIKSVKLWRMKPHSEIYFSEFNKLIEKAGNDWERKVFAEFDLLELTKKVLRECGQDSGGRKINNSLTAHQLACGIARAGNFSNNVSPAMLYKELARKIWTGEVEDIRIEFMTGRDNFTIGFAASELTRLSKYIPIFRYVG